jgi:hypothetical protein
MANPKYISRDLLIELFPPVKVNSSEIHGVAPEVGSYWRDMGGKSWTDVAPEIYERHTDALTCLDVGSLRYFLAGFLAVATDDPFSHSARSLAYHVCDSERCKTLCEYLKPMQSSCVFDVAEYTLSVREGSNNRDLALIRRNRLHVLFPPPTLSSDKGEDD